MIYRYGLDEFACVTPHSHNLNSGQLANDLLASIRSHPIAVSSGLLFPLTISIGGAVQSLEKDEPSTATEPTFGELISLAEQSLLQAQKSGGNRAYIEEIPKM